MLVDAKSRGRPAGSKTRHHGLLVAAQKLDVTANHLWKVITGQRESATLLDKVRREFPALLPDQYAKAKTDPQTLSTP